MDEMKKPTNSWLHAILLLLSTVSLHGVVISPNQDTCGGHLTNTTGTILSPNYPDVYPRELSCEWIIIAPNGHGVTLTVKEFNVDDVVGRFGDKMKIYDNDPSQDSNKPKWPALTGYIQKGRVFTTNFNRMWLVFTSDTITLSQKAKFQIDYKVAPAKCPDLGTPPNGSRRVQESDTGYLVLYRCSPGYILKGNVSLSCSLAGHGGWSGTLPQCVVPCVGEEGRPPYFTVPNDRPVILSPNSTGARTCFWRIEVDFDSYVNLTAEVMDLKGSFLEIWDRSYGANILGNFSGNMFPTYLVSSSNKIFIKLQFTNASLNFKLRYTVSSDKNCKPPKSALNMYHTPVKSSYKVNEWVEYSCMEGFVLSRSTVVNLRARCTVGKQWTSVSLPRCVADCREWDPDQKTYQNVVFRNQTGVIYSPGFPGPFSKMSCEYRVHLSPGQLIEFDLSKVDLDATTEIRIYSGGNSGNGTLTTTITNRQKAMSVRSLDSVASVLIQKNRQGRSRKFVIHYRGLTSDVCRNPAITNGYILSSNNGMVYSISTMIRLACVPFYEIMGASEVMCLRGERRNRWNPPLPNCVGRCGGTYSLLMNGTIVSPLYPSKYKGRGPCTWDIKAPAPTKRGVLYLVSFRVDLLQLASKDQLYLAPVGGTRVNLKGKEYFNVTTPSAGFKLSFLPSSEDFTPGKIFKLSYQSVTFVPTSCPEPSGQLRISEGSKTLRSAAAFECKPPYNLMGFDGSSCSESAHGIPVWSPSLPECTLECGMDGEGEFERDASRGGGIANPGYPDTIKGKQDCRWVIRALPGYRVTASFRYLDLPKQHKSISVRIFDGANPGHQRPLLVQTQYGVVPPNVTSLSAALTIHFTSLQDDVPDHRGFYVQYGMVQFTGPAAPTTTTKRTANTKPGETTKAPGVPYVLLKTTANSPSPENNQRVGNMKTPIHTGPSTGVVVTAVILSAILITIVGVGGYYWYRKRYPARMVIGRTFPKFHNPLYERQPTSVSSTLNLDRDFNLSSSSSNSLS